MRVKQLKLFGVEVFDVNLSEVVYQDVISVLKNLVKKHSLVIFRNQGVIDGDVQLAITRWFGDVETIGFEQHPKSPSPHILRASNDEEEGFRDFGAAGFHVDGSFMKCPNSHSVYHTIVTPPNVKTAFVHLPQAVRSLKSEQLKRWERLWLLKTFKRIRGFSNEPGFVIHPLVYPHPVSLEKVGFSLNIENKLFYHFYCNFFKIF